VDAGDAGDEGGGAVVLPHVLAGALAELLQRSGVLHEGGELLGPVVGGGLAEQAGGAVVDQVVEQGVAAGDDRSAQPCVWTRRWGVRLRGGTKNLPDDMTIDAPDVSIRRRCNAVLKVFDLCPSTPCP